MKRITIVVLLALSLGQGVCEAVKRPEPSLEQVITQLKKQNQLLEEQNALLRQLLPPPPKQHRKAVRVLLRTLTVVDHAGSVASLVSLFGVSIGSKF